MRKLNGADLSHPSDGHWTNVQDVSQKVLVGVGPSYDPSGRATHRAGLGVEPRGAHFRLLALSKSRRDRNLSEAKCQYSGCDKTATWINNPGLTWVCDEHQILSEPVRSMYWRRVQKTERGRMAFLEGRFRIKEMG